MIVSKINLCDSVIVIKKKKKEMIKGAVYRRSYRANAFYVLSRPQLNSREALRPAFGQGAVKNRVDNVPCKTIFTLHI